MASGGCKDAFVAPVDCVAAAVKYGSGTPTTTQPLPCLDAVDSFIKCMEENAGEYAHTLDLIASVSGAGEGEADANNANRGLVLGLMKMEEAQLKVQKAAAEMEFACKDAVEALQECAAAGGMTATALPPPCLEAAASLEKCMEELEHADKYFCMLNRIAAGAGEVGVTANRRVDDY